MAPRSRTAEASRASNPSAGSAHRSVRITLESGVFRISSADGEVGGIFVSLDAARRFAEREFHHLQGRELLDELDEPDELGDTKPR